MDQRSTFRLEDQLLQDSPAHKNSLKKSRPIPRRKRFQSIIKNFIGRGKQTMDSPTADITDATTTTGTATVTLEPTEKIESVLNKPLERQNIFDNNGSNIQLCDNKKITDSTLSLVTVQQKLWNVVPLLKRENSRGNSINGKSNSVVKYTSMRKCETVLALTRQFSTYSYIPEEIEIENCKSPGTFYKRSISLNVPELKHFHNAEPIQPLNRLRSCKSVKSNTNCSRCSSILSESQTSLKNVDNENNSDGRRFSNYESTNKINYIPRIDSDEIHQLRRASIISNRNSSEKDEIDGGKLEAVNDEFFTCKLCLIETNVNADSTKIMHCGCNFCTECMKCYVEFEIKEGAYEISCPDAQCSGEGVLSLTEISSLVPPDLMEKHNRYRFNREVELDKSRTWCPRAGCETVCLISPQSTSSTNGKTTIPGSSNSNNKSKSNETIIPYAVQCPTCQEEFCPECRKPWHQNLSCEEYRKRLVEEGLLEEISDFPYESDSIKFCPMCGVPIEKDSGCAQMMCKRCKHVFCWYCLASLDDDFLLRHYDAGPCKNKLGHSRASVVWHRAQVIGIFAGFGMLLVIASPLLLLAVPCILCCKCHPCCSGESKTEDADTDFDEVPLGR